MNTPEMVIAVTDTVDAGGDVFEVLAPTFKAMAEQRQRMNNPPEGQPHSTRGSIIVSNAGTLIMGAVEQRDALIPKLKDFSDGCKAIWKAFKDPALPDAWDKKRKQPARCNVPELPKPVPDEKEPEPEKE